MCLCINTLTIESARQTPRAHANSQQRALDLPPDLLPSQQTLSDSTGVTQALSPAP